MDFKRKEIKEFNPSLIEYIVYAFAFVGFVLIISLLAHNDELSPFFGEYSFVSPGFQAGKTVKVAYLQQSIILGIWWVIFLLVYVKFFQRLIKEGKYSTYIVELLEYVFMALAVVALNHILKIGEPGSHTLFYYFGFLLVFKVIQLVYKYFTDERDIKSVNQKIKKR